MMKKLQKSLSKVVKKDIKKVSNAMEKIGIGALKGILGNKKTSIFPEKFLKPAEEVKGQEDNSYK